MALELDSLEKSIASLGRTLAFSEKVAKDDAETMEIARTAVIQCFEVAYELCWKFMQRWMDLNVSPDAVTMATKREFYRHAAENGLILDVDEWMGYHQARNETAHTYNLEKAMAIAAVARGFHAEAGRFLGVLKQHND